MKAARIEKYIKATKMPRGSINHDPVSPTNIQIHVSKKRIIILIRPFLTTKRDERGEIRGRVT